jgi:PEGA domain
VSPHQSPPARTESSTVWAIVAALGVLALLLGYFTRSGRLAITVKPGDAVLAIDGVPMQAAAPLVLEAHPGHHRVSAERPGYLRQDRSIELRAGEAASLDLELEPTPDTGFELTSEPPGGLVWMDGQPFTGTDPEGPQARTNFKAYPVAPGAHVLEMKGDPRFENWKQRFVQEPGKIMKVHAILRPRPGLVP